VPGVAVTLGEVGALLSDGAGAPFFAPAVHRSGPARDGDTCGAGDSFAAAVTGVLADGGPLTDAVRAGVRRAGDFVAAGGAAAVRAGRRAGDPADGGPLADDAGRFPAGGPPPAASARAAGAWEVVERTRRGGGTVVATGGCFDLLHAGHVALLRQARRLGDCLVVCVNSDESVRRRKGRGRPITPAADRVRVLEALAAVDATIVFPDDTPEPLLARLRPDIWVKGADCAGARMPEADTVRAHGGEVVLLPFLAGRSTTRLLSAAHAAKGVAL
jgi:rfaE bifunctional protein nucleotidyltransferase chain/domain